MFKNLKSYLILQFKYTYIKYNKDYIITEEINWIQINI